MEKSQQARQTIEKAGRRRNRAIVEGQPTVAEILRYIWQIEHMKDRPNYRLTRSQQARLHDYRREAAKTNGQKDESVKVASRERAPTVFDGVKAAVHQFMTLTIFSSQPTPLNTVCTQKTYGMRIRYTTKAEGQISWEGDKTVLCCKIKFNLSDIRAVVHGLLSTARQRLVRELLISPAVERGSAKTLDSSV